LTVKKLGAKFLTLERLALLDIFGTGREEGLLASRSPTSPRDLFAKTSWW
jgi:hypothetical protein